MKPIRIVILSGSPGTGKTTIARILAENSAYEKAVHIEVDDFWQFIRKGYIVPWLDDSVNQNDTVMDAVAASAQIYSESGYEVFVAGTIGPWFVELWLEMAQKGIDVRYIILRPSEDATILRATERVQREIFPLNAEIVKDVRSSFTALGIYESNVVDTTSQTVEESVAFIQNLLDNGYFRIVPASEERVD